ncbi:hypothetical protein R1flu_004981 [Riccia fluitans]|uniref:LAGLIDADG homing endonuclease n=1 Tax=Riccia fluitans TaxID=41844 RepID=A0ABD1YVU7_9MARC
MKAKEVKISHLNNENKKKLENRSLGGLFASEWNQAHEDLVKELSDHFDQKIAFPKYEYHEKSEAWTSKVWREVYNLCRIGYVMKGKIQLIELQLLKLVKGDKQQSKSRVFLKQVEGNSDFILFCQILNSILAPVRPEHFQHNQIAWSLQRTYFLRFLPRALVLSFPRDEQQEDGEAQEAKRS